MVGDALSALLSFGGAALGGAAGSAISGSADDDGTGAALTNLAAVLVLLGVTCLVELGLLGWAQHGVVRGLRAARTLVTVVLVADAVLVAALSATTDAVSALSMLVWGPIEVAVLVLLWGAENSRRFFGDPPRTVTTGHASADPVS